MENHTHSIPRLNDTDKVVIIVDLMVGIVPPWAETRNDLPSLVSALTGMNEHEAKNAVRDAEEKKLIKYFNPFDDAQS